jgi:hypothetical protein
MPSSPEDKPRIATVKGRAAFPTVRQLIGRMRRAQVLPGLMPAAAPATRSDPQRSFITLPTAITRRARIGGGPAGRP